MYPTYEHILKVYQDPNLTPSQKMHEIFKNSKTESLKKWIDCDMFKEYPIDPSLKIDQAEVVEVDGDGQIITFRYPDNTYYFIDAGMYTTIEDVDHIFFGSFGDSCNFHIKGVIDAYLEDLLYSEIYDNGGDLVWEDPQVFERGFWIDKDLEVSFLNSRDLHFTSKT